MYPEHIKSLLKSLPADQPIALNGDYYRLRDLDGEAVLEKIAHGTVRVDKKGQTWFFNKPTGRWRKQKVNASRNPRKRTIDLHELEASVGDIRTQGGHPYVFTGDTWMPLDDGSEVEIGGETHVFKDGKFQSKTAHEKDKQERAKQRSRNKKRSDRNAKRASSRKAKSSGGKGSGGAKEGSTPATDVQDWDKRLGDLEQFAPGEDDGPKEGAPTAIDMQNVRKGSWLSLDKGFTAWRGPHVDQSLLAHKRTIADASSWLEQNGGDTAYATFEVGHHPNPERGKASFERKARKIAEGAGYTVTAIAPLTEKGWPREGEYAVKMERKPARTFPWTNVSTEGMSRDDYIALFPRTREGIKDAFGVADDDITQFPNGNYTLHIRAEDKLPGSLINAVKGRTLQELAYFYALETGQGKDMGRSIKDDGPKDGDRLHLLPDEYVSVKRISSEWSKNPVYRYHVPDYNNIEEVRTTRRIKPDELEYYKTRGIVEGVREVEPTSQYGPARNQTMEIDMVNLTPSTIEFKTRKQALDYAKENIDALNAGGMRLEDEIEARRQLPPNDGAKEGDRKTIDGHTYELRGGRWHRVDDDTLDVENEGNTYDTAEEAISQDPDASGLGGDGVLGIQPGTGEPGFDYTTGSGGSDGTGVIPRIVAQRAEYTQQGDTSLIPDPLKPHLSDDQQQGAALAIAAMQKTGGFLLADGTGVGKSRELLTVANHYAQQGRKVVIVAPNQVIKKDWKKGTFSGSYRDDSALMGIEMELHRGREPLTEGAIALTTYDALKDMKKQIDGNTVVLFDESHALKNMTLSPKETGRTGHAKEMMEAAGAVCYATASPIDKPTHIPYLFKTDIFNGNQVRDVYSGWA